jgi:hypothetical protein
MGVSQKFSKKKKSENWSNNLLQKLPVRGW